jgi:hypothetical protein
MQACRSWSRLLSRLRENARNKRYGIIDEQDWVPGVIIPNIIQHRLRIVGNHIKIRVQRARFWVAPGRGCAYNWHISGGVRSREIGVRMNESPPALSI